MKSKLEHCGNDCNDNIPSKTAIFKKCKFSCVIYLGIEYGQCEECCPQTY